MAAVVAAETLAAVEKSWFLKYTEEGREREDVPPHVRAGSGVAWIRGPGDRWLLAVAQDDCASLGLVAPPALSEDVAHVGWVKLPVVGSETTVQFDKAHKNKKRKADLESVSTVLLPSFPVSAAEAEAARAVLGPVPEDSLRAPVVVVPAATLPARLEGALQLSLAVFGSGSALEEEGSKREDRGWVFFVQWNAEHGVWATAALRAHRFYALLRATSPFDTVEMLNLEGSAMTTDLLVPGAVAAAEADPASLTMRLLQRGYAKDPSSPIIDATIDVNWKALYEHLTGAVADPPAATAIRQFFLGVAKYRIPAEPADAAVSGAAGGGGGGATTTAAAVVEASKTAGSSTLGEVRLTFSDLAPTRTPGTMVYLASAEAEDPDEEGEVVGAVIGRLRFHEDGTASATQVPLLVYEPDGVVCKPEGAVQDREDDHVIWVVCDPDDPFKAVQLCRVRLSRHWVV